jgi:hypothetical protein
MNRLLDFSNGLQRFTTRRYILPLFVLLVIVLAFMEVSPIGSARLKALSGGTGMLDMEFGYSPAQVYGFLDRIGDAGQQIYKVLLGLDYLFAVVFMLLQALLITNLLQRAGINHSGLQLLNLLPFVRSALDALENCFLLAILFQYPAQFPALVAASSALTISKLVVHRMIIVLTFSLGAWISTRTLLLKNKVQVGGKA